MYEASLRIKDDSAYAAATMGNVASVELWCNEHCDMLHASDEAGSDVLDRARDTVGVAASVECGDESIVVAVDCLRDHEINYIEGYVRKHGLLLASPLRYRGRTRVCCLLTVLANDLMAYFRDLVNSGFDVSAESKRTVLFISGSGPFLAPADAMLAFTGRQCKALRLAHVGGYYDPPHGIETATIADEMGVPRRIVEEHLRRAERKVMDLVVQYVL